jgi:hypothetical protein
MAHRLAGRDHFVEPRARSFAVVLRQGSVLYKVADQCLDLVIREVAAGHAVPRFDGVFTRSICCFNWAYFQVEQGVQQVELLCAWAAIGTFLSARVS